MPIGNFYSVNTIIFFRVKDFIKEYNYTIISPLVNTLIFVIIFSTIDSYYSIFMDNMSFFEFLIPGLILIAVVQTSFDYSSATLIHMKQIGNFDDFLMAPISRLEIFLSFLISTVIVGLFIGLLNYFILSFFIGLHLIEIFYFFYYLILVALIFSSIGCVVGFLTYKWDTQSTISNFFITPINLLSGTFFSINSVPDSFKFLFVYNPYYYVVSNFRLAFYNNFEYDGYTNFFIFIFVFLFIILSAYIFSSGYNVIK